MPFLSPPSPYTRIHTYTHGIGERPVPKIFSHISLTGSCQIGVLKPSPELRLPTNLEIWLRVLGKDEGGVVVAVDKSSTGHVAALPHGCLDGAMGRSLLSLDLLVEGLP